jgi:hypothetical protein
MENTKSPFDTLFGESLPRLLQTMEEYHALAVPHCTPEQIQLLAELQRRIKQCEFLLMNVAAIEERQLDVAMNVLAAVAGKQPDADKHFDASCQDIDTMWLFTESFYWVAHKVNAVVVAKHACFKGRRLPKMPSNVRTAGVTSVRNYLVEHPFEYKNQFGLGGIWCGPVLNGGLGEAEKNKPVQDPGLYLNAIEWADTISQVLSRASEELQKDAA